MAELIVPGQPEKPLGGSTTSTEADIPETADVVEAKTAFIIYVLEDGTTVMSPDITLNVVTDRAPTINEVYSACGVVLKDIQNQETAALSAQFVMNAQMQMAAKMRDAQLNAQAMSGLKLR